MAVVVGLVLVTGIGYYFFVAKPAEDKIAEAQAQAQANAQALALAQAQAKANQSNNNNGGNLLGGLLALL